MKINANVSFGFGGWPVVGVQAPLENQVLAIVTDNEDTAQAITRRRPQPLNAVHGAAITDKPQHWPVWKRQRGTHRGRQAPTNPSTLQTKIVPRLATRQKFA